jgi:hypothetical protein
LTVCQIASIFPLGLALHVGRILTVTGTRVKGARAKSTLGLYIKKLLEICYRTQQWRGSGQVIVKIN